jgi:hypothetical protein
MLTAYEGDFVQHCIAGVRCQGAFTAHRMENTPPLERLCCFYLLQASSRST